MWYKLWPWSSMLLRMFNRTLNALILSDKNINCCRFWCIVLFIAKNCVHNWLNFRSSIKLNTTNSRLITYVHQFNSIFIFPGTSSKFTTPCQIQHCSAWMTLWNRLRLSALAPTYSSGFSAMSHSTHKSSLAMWCYTFPRRWSATSSKSGFFFRWLAVFR